MLSKIIIYEPLNVWSSEQAFVSCNQSLKQLDRKPNITPSDSKQRRGNARTNRKAWVANKSVKRGVKTFDVTLVAEDEVTNCFRSAPTRRVDAVTMNVTSIIRLATPCLSLP